MGEPEQPLFVFDVPFDELAEFLRSNYGSSIRWREICWRPYDRLGTEIRGFSASSARSVAGFIKLIFDDAEFIPPLPRERWRSGTLPEDEVAETK